MLPTFNGYNLENVKVSTNLWNHHHNWGHKLTHHLLKFPPDTLLFEFFKYNSSESLPWVCPTAVKYLLSRLHGLAWGWTETKTGGPGSLRAHPVQQGCGRADAGVWRHQRGRDCQFWLQGSGRVQGESRKSGASPPVSCTWGLCVHVSEAIHPRASSILVSCLMAHKPFCHKENLTHFQRAEIR